MNVGDDREKRGEKVHTGGQKRSKTAIFTPPVPILLGRKAPNLAYATISIAQ